MTPDHPRYSTSDDLLEHSLSSAAGKLGCETRLIRIRDLQFRACEGYYSKASRACTWPCSITQMDPSDQMDQVYEGIVHWADVIIVATPIRWGAASSLYYKMVERMNCVQNQETIANKHLLRNKVAGFIITGGQDNVQAVAGQLLGFSPKSAASSPVPLHRPLEGLERRGHGTQSGVCSNSTALHEGAEGLPDAARRWRS